MQRYCDICEKEVKTSYIVVESGIRYARGECGHKTRIVEQRKESPIFIMKGLGYHNSDYGQYGRR